MDKSFGRRTLAVADAKFIAIAKPIVNTKLIADPRLTTNPKPIINTNPAASLYLPARPHPVRATWHNHALRRSASPASGRDAVSSAFANAAAGPAHRHSHLPHRRCSAARP